VCLCFFSLALSLSYVLAVVGTSVPFLCLVACIIGHVHHLQKVSVCFVA
jgi:hypothetical protein